MDAQSASSSPRKAAHYPLAADRIVYDKTETAPVKGVHPISDHLSQLPFLLPSELENFLLPRRDMDSFLETAAHMPSCYGGLEIPFSSFCDIEPFFGLTVPCREMLTTLKQVLADHPQSKKIVEVGAGSGYLSAFFQQAGFEVTATDINPESRDSRYVPIEKISATEALKAYPDHSVLLSWPMPGPTDIKSGLRSSKDIKGSILDLIDYFSPENFLAVIKGLKRGNYLFYIHGTYPAISGEPYFLNAIKSCCNEIVGNYRLPVLPDDEGSILHVFRKTPYLLSCSV